MGSSKGQFVTHKFETCPGWGAKFLIPLARTLNTWPDARTRPAPQPLIKSTNKQHKIAVVGSDLVGCHEPEIRNPSLSDQHPVKWVAVVPRQ